MQRVEERRGGEGKFEALSIFVYSNILFDPVRSVHETGVGIGSGLDRCTRATWRRNLAWDRNYEGISWKSWPTRADKVSGEGGRGSLHTPSDETHAISRSGAVIQTCFPKWERGLVGS